MRWILPLQLSLKKPVRISGPLVSSKMATFLSATAKVPDDWAHCMAV